MVRRTIEDLAAADQDRAEQEAKTERDGQRNMRVRHGRFVCFLIEIGGPIFGAVELLAGLAGDNGSEIAHLLADRLGGLRGLTRGG